MFPLSHTERSSPYVAERAPCAFLIERGSWGMKKKIIALNAVLVIGVSSVIMIPTAYAESLSNLNQKKANIQDKRSDVKVDINDTEEKINKLKSQQLTVEDQLVENC